MNCFQLFRSPLCFFALISIIVVSSVALGQEKPKAKPNEDPKAKVVQAQKESEKTAAIRKLFNGKDLTGWTKIKESYFEESGDIKIVDGEIELGKGSAGTGIIVDGENRKKLLKMNYQIELDAKRVEGGDFFCGMTFPIKEEYLSLIIGGWGGQVCGLSNLNDLSAIENETTHVAEFKNGTWYHIKLRVTPEKVETWIDKEKIIDVELKDKKLSIWWEQEPVRPLGVSTWYTKARIRNIVVTDLTKLPKKDKVEKKEKTDSAKKQE